MPPIPLEDEDFVPIPLEEEELVPIPLEDEDFVPIPLEYEPEEPKPEDEEDMQEPDEEQETPTPEEPKHHPLVPVALVPFVVEPHPLVPLVHYHTEEGLYLIEGTNVVLDYSLAMVIGFVHKSILIRAPIQEVRDVCQKYDLLYFGDVLKELDVEMQ